MTLSDKIFDTKLALGDDISKIFTKDVKEFIKELKEDIRFREQFGQVSGAEIEIINEIIDELAGKELTTQTVEEAKK